MPPVPTRCTLTDIIFTSSIIIMFILMAGDQIRRNRRMKSPGACVAGFRCIMLARSNKPKTADVRDLQYCRATQRFI